MNIDLSQQVPATYARNNFKEVNDKAIQEGMCVIMRKSKPVTVILSVEEYEKILEKGESVEKKKKPKRKITLKQLREDDFFDAHAGCMKKDYPKMTALEWQHNWHKYVD